MVKTTFIKKFSVAGVVGALLLANFLPITTLKAHAAITDGEGSQTSYSSTFVKTESITEDVPYGTDLAAYINGKKAEWEDSEMGQGVTDSYRTAWEALFIANDNLDIYRYPVWVSTTFKGVSISEECGGSGEDALLIGDTDYITGSTQIDSGCATFHYDVAYQEVNVAFGYEHHIREVNFTMTPLAAGTVFTQSDPEDEDTQRPQLDITLPADAKYHLWGDDESLNYSYLYSEKVLDMDYSKLFTGTIEKGGKYYAEIWLQVNNYATTVFDSDFKLFVNGVETPYEYVNGEPSSIGVAILIELDVPADDESVEEESTSSVSAPNTGAFTSSSSATPAISGITTVATLLGFAYFLKRKSTRR